MSLTINEIQTLITDKHDLREIINEMADYLQANPGSSSSYLVAEKILTDAQIKALPSTPVDILAAPGSGKFFDIITASFVLDMSNGFYDNVTNGAITLKIDSVAACTASVGLGEGSDVYYGKSTQSDISGVSVSNIENKNINISISNTGNFTGGNAANTLKVIVYYVLIDL